MILHFVVSVPQDETTVSSECFSCLEFCRHEYLTLYFENWHCDRFHKSVNTCCQIISIRSGTFTPQTTSLKAVTVSCMLVSNQGTKKVYFKQRTFHVFFEAKAPQSRTKKDHLMCVPSALQQFSRLRIPLGYILYHLY